MEKKERSTWAANAYQEGGHVGFCKDFGLKCELQPGLLPVQLHGPEQMQVQVLVQVPKPLLLPEMVLLVELVPVSEHVSVSMPDPPVDQPDPLTWSVPNP